MSSQKRQRKREGRLARQEAMRAAQRQAQRRRAIVIVAALAVLALLVVLLANVVGDDEESTEAGPDTTAKGSLPRADPVAAGATITGDTPCPAADGSSPQTSKFEKPPPMCIDPAKAYTAVFDTSEGSVEVALDTRRTPATVNNFVVLSRYHYYDGSSLHRTDPSIDIVQGGSPSTQTLADPGPGYTVADEGSGFTYGEGDLVMARGPDPNSGGAQFFFVAGPKASALDTQGNFVTFGKVGQGLDVVKKVLGLHQDCPQGEEACLGGAPRRVVMVESVKIRESQS